MSQETYRKLSYSEERAVYSCFGNETDDSSNAFMTAGAMRGALRNAEALGSLIVSALSVAGGVSPLDVFMNATGWGLEETEEFLKHAREE